MSNSLRTQGPQHARFPCPPLSPAYLCGLPLPGLQCFRNFRGEPEVLTTPRPCLGRSELQFLSLQDSASAKGPAEFLSLLAAASLSVSPPLPCVRVHCSALTSALGRTGCGIPVLSSLGVSFTLESCPLSFWLCCIPIVVFSAQ